MWRIRAPLLALLLMQVVLLASAGATAVKKPLGKQDTCNMKNHMIEYLRNNGVQIYERPQISSVYCNSEWSEFGTCCDSTTLNHLIDSRIRQNLFAVDSINEEIIQAPKRLKEFRDKYLVSNSARRRLWALGNQMSYSTKNHPKHSPPDISKEGLNALNLARLPPSDESNLIGSATKSSNPTIPEGTIKASGIIPLSPNVSKDSSDDTPVSTVPSSVAPLLDQILVWLTQNQTAAAASQLQCVEQVNQMIRLSSCPICSGRSDDFWEYGGDKNPVYNFKITAGVCKSIFSQCSAAWSHLMQFERDVSTFVDLVLSTSNYGAGQGQSFISAKMITDKVSSFIQKKNLIPIYLKCGSKKLADCSFEHVAALCEQFIHIQAPPYLAPIEQDNTELQREIQAVQNTIKFAQSKWDSSISVFAKQTEIVASPKTGFNLGTLVQGYKDMIQPTSILINGWYLLKSKQILIEPSRMGLKGSSMIQELLDSIEQMIASYQILKWRRLENLVAKIPSNGQTELFTQQLAEVWDPETTLIDEWSRSQPRDSSEQQKLTQLTSVANKRAQAAFGCSPKDEILKRRLFTRALLTRLHKSLAPTSTSSPSIEQVLASFFPPLPPGPKLPSSDCKTIQQNEFTSGGDGTIETGGIVTDPQCNPCFGGTGSNNSSYSGP